MPQVGFGRLLAGQPPQVGGSSGMARPVAYKEYKSTADQNLATLRGQLAQYRQAAEAGDEDAYIQLEHVLAEIRELRTGQLQERGRHETEVKRGVTKNLLIPQAKEEEALGTARKPWRPGQPVALP